MFTILLKLRSAERFFICLPEMSHFISQIWAKNFFINARHRDIIKVLNLKRENVITGLSDTAVIRTE